MIDKELLVELLERARQQGASDADVIAVESESTSVKVRMGEVEQVEQARE